MCEYVRSECVRSECEYVTSECVRSECVRDV